MRMPTSLFARTVALAVLALALAACSPTPPTGDTEAKIGEYYDNHHDIVWQTFLYGATNQGAITLGHYTAGATSVNENFLPNFVGAGWKVRLDGDFYGDGASALLLQGNDSGSDSWGPSQMYMLWRVDGGAVRETPLIARNVPAEWTVISAIDVDNDGHDDIVWQNRATGDIGVWIMNGAAAPQRFTLTHFTPSPSLVAVDAGRFDGTTPAVLLHDTTAGMWRTVGIAAWGVPVFSVTGWPLATIRPEDTAWREIGVGDANGDGKTDVWWFNPTSQQIGIWLMSGNQSASNIVGYAYPGINYAPWVPVQVADYDGDGIADVLWHNPQNQHFGVWRVAAGGTSCWNKQDLGSMSCWSTFATLGTHGDTLNACFYQGTPGGACLADGICFGNLACVGGTCYDPNDPTLGTLGHACKPSTSACVDGKSTCVDNVCVAAGGLNQPCNFNVTPRCQAPLVCSPKTTTCVGCGNAGEPCCAGSCSGAGAVCDPQTSMCIVCGLQGEQCCPPDLVKGGGTPIYASACGQNDTAKIAALECRNDQCVACGYLNAPCCTHTLNPCVNVAGGFCDTGNVCHSSSTTTASGASLVPSFAEVSPLPGEKFTLDWSVTNYGNQTTKPGGFSVKIEFGPDSPGTGGPDFSDVQDVSFGALAPGATVTGAVPLTLPDDSHYYVARITADSGSQVTNMAGGTNTVAEYYLP